jgi:hypothetical protein
MNDLTRLVALLETRIQELRAIPVRHRAVNDVRRNTLVMGRFLYA